MHIPLQDFLASSHASQVYLATQLTESWQRWRHLCSPSITTMQKSTSLIPTLTSEARRQLPSSSSNLVRSRLPIYIPSRQFASQGQHEPPLSGSSKEAAELRDRLERQSKTAPGANANAKFGPERVGPFPMGGGRVSSKKWAPWKELDIGGKGECL